MNLIRCQTMFDVCYFLYQNLDHCCQDASMQRDNILPTGQKIKFHPARVKIGCWTWSKHLSCNKKYFVLLKKVNLIVAFVSVYMGTNHLADSAEYYLIVGIDLAVLVSDI